MFAPVVHTARPLCLASIIGNRYGHHMSGDAHAKRAAAFDALVTAHTERLCRFVYKYVRSREAAEDIVQDVFLSVWEGGYEWEGRDPLPFLYRSAHNRAISYARRHQVHERFQRNADSDAAFAAPNTAALGTDIHDALVQSELEQALAAAID